tara:strand:+ start:239 stop:994 length:756 start_codon:yes stop_codon:yes gene_type:complete
MHKQLNKRKKRNEGGFFEFIRTVFWAIIIAVIFRSLLFEPYNIPSGSMLPNLLVGDYLFVSKYSYGYSRFSFPFGIVPIPSRVWSSKPKRGDVVVFKLPSDTSINYIKRLIGMPGDKVQMKKGELYLNNHLVDQKKEGNYEFIHPNYLSNVSDKYKETMPNGKQYYVLNDSNFSQLDETEVFVVPEGHYFMMGDNRDNSLDSRASVGFVPFENFVGKGSIIFFSVNGSAKIWQIWKWPTSIRYSRLFKKIN